MPKLAISLDEAVEESVRDALEEMFFIILFGRASQGSTSDPKAVAAQLNFTGEEHGVVRIALSPHAAAEAAANFLGEDRSGITTEQTQTVVCELANIICGSALSRWRGDALFHLAQPQLVAADAPPLAEARELSFELEQGTLSVWVSCAEPVE